jgi:hypothetical protein
VSVRGPSASGAATQPGNLGARASGTFGRIPGSTTSPSHNRTPPRQRGGLVVEVATGGGDVLSVGSGSAREVRHPVDLVAGFETRDADADLLDDAGDVPSENERRLSDVETDPRGGVLAQLYFSKRDAEFPEAEARGIETRFMLVEPDLIGLQTLSRLVTDVKLRVHVSETFSLEEFAKAHEAMEAGHATGKIVITVD